MVLHTRDERCPGCHRRRHLGLRKGRRAAGACAGVARGDALKRTPCHTGSYPRSTEINPKIDPCDHNTRRRWPSAPPSARAAPRGTGRPPSSSSMRSAAPVPPPLSLGGRLGRDVTAKCDCATATAATGARPDLISWNAALAALDKGRQPRRAVRAARRRGRTSGAAKSARRVTRFRRLRYSTRWRRRACSPTPSRTTPRCLRASALASGTRCLSSSRGCGVRAARARRTPSPSTQLSPHAPPPRGLVVPQLTPAVALQAGLVSLNALESRLLRALGRRT